MLQTRCVDGPPCCPSVSPEDNFSSIMNSVELELISILSSGDCTLSIRVDKIPNQTVRIGLLTVGVMTVFALVLFGIRYCTKRMQTSAPSGRDQVMNPTMRREYLAEVLRRSVQNASSPEAHRAITFPLRGPAQAPYNPLDDPPPSYDQVVAASK